jgi:RNA polymerase subunit RPABC4/transcription elongation factor Spt4
MRCPNCERVVSMTDLRCRVCHQRLTIWYVFTVFIVVVILAGIIFLMEQI